MTRKNPERLASELLSQKEAHLQEIERLKAEVERQKESLLQYRALVETEQAIAKNIFEHIICPKTINLPNLRYIISPLSTFNGDILLANREPTGLIHLMLGDFTGHGLPAAIGALPLAEIFYSMTGKGLKTEEIILEMNRKLNILLPRNIFCAAMYIEINEHAQEIRFWNGGLPDGILYRPQYGVFKQLSPQSLPLGILTNQQLDLTMETFSLKANDRIYLYTDGLTDARNANKETFSKTRINNIINNTKLDPSEIFNTILRELSVYGGTEQQMDDVTLLEFKVLTK